MSLFRILFTVPMHYYTGKGPATPGGPHDQKSSSYQLSMAVVCEHDEIEHVAQDLQRKFKAASFEVITTEPAATNGIVYCGNSI